MCISHKWGMKHYFETYFHVYRLMDPSYLLEMREFGDKDQYERSVTELNMEVGAPDCCYNKQFIDRILEETQAWRYIEKLPVLEFDKEKSGLSGFEEVHGDDKFAKFLNKETGELKKIPENFGRWSYVMRDHILLQEKLYSEGILNKKLDFFLNEEDSILEKNDGTHRGITILITRKDHLKKFLRRHISYDRIKYATTIYDILNDFIDGLDFVVVTFG